ncbi:helix-hairpin-helix domain-containing protein [Mediterraneibacter sp. NSJ-55]|uniref:Helix-hairpin-helix domain-containing protein n=1 Tax=Mediterraneibacter hominis TaxID=2763054 RepID=A0A923LF42_9FIRM|nr:helix-hairpin-helix domain-containing protein [Mediterraneibacter hominis]MBC5687446.1 helix-hairpin-helix domain-containing protein [Mediterraneibacter hominis]
MRDNRKHTILLRVLTGVLAGVLLSGCKSSQQDSLKEAALETEVVSEEKAEEKDGDTVDKQDEKEEKSAGQEEDTAFVYVCGAVISPGVYELDSSARIYEAIACAGGVTEEAAQEALNQARKVVDGERIYVPTKEELADGTFEDIASADGVVEEPGGSDNGVQGKININTAGLEELKTLSGIGDAKAQSIIRYREENGAFQNIEDVMKVEGIKEGVFNKIKDEITV